MENELTSREISLLQEQAKRLYEVKDILNEYQFELYFIGCASSLKELSKDNP